MRARPTEPRIPVVSDGEASDVEREFLDTLGPAGGMHIFRTLVRHPKLFRSWLPFAGRLLQGSALSPRDRELVILRVAWRCGSRYEWGQHVSIARQAGLSDDEIRRIAAGPNNDRWSSEDRALLQAVDEIEDDHCVSDATWTALSGRYTTPQMIELTMLAGHYRLLAGTLNSLGVQPEGPMPDLGEA